jgi:phosphohistidine phosphatase
MRRLILMRHGKAEAATAQSDHERALVPRGRAEALEAARRMMVLAAPEAALVSDSRRTHQTFDSAAPALPAGLPCRFTRTLYGASATAILAEVKQTSDDFGCLLVIGHNPGICDLARSLARKGSTRDLERLASGFPTSCFAIIDIKAESWSELDGPGRLVFLLPPDERAAK